MNCSKLFPYKLELGSSVSVPASMCVTPDIAGELIQTYKETQPGENVSKQKLTERQREILQLIVDGHLTKEIADILCISVRTIERHKYNTMQELKLKTTADLIKYAIKQGIVAI
ncbi:response regulator transcription factor [Thermodesulfobacteriota bacterium]